MTGEIYNRLGTRRVVNALGVYTDLGGSRLSPTVWATMEQANQSFARMPELLETSGQVVAELLRSEAARVTPGASSAIAMAIAACMTGNDPRMMEQLPDVTGMPSQVLIQRRHRYKYDRMVRLTGAELVEIGNVNGTEPQEFEAAISERTAAVFFPAHLDSLEGTVALEVVASIAHAHDVPLVVDAAYLNFPVEIMSTFTARGADLVIFSAKYFIGPNAGGIICGRGDLIEAVAGVDFTRFEASKYLSFGRPFKLDRQLVVGVVEALREWLEMNHTKRFADYGRAVEAIARCLDDLPGLELTPMSFTMEETLELAPVNCLRVRPLDRPALAAAVAARLAAGDPSILVHELDGAIVADVECVSYDEAELIGKRLHEELVEPV
jgi:D-glucosaminate-6-phosphate ammonia-lyase